ncbi:MAG TPA: protein kinase, partial [Acidobacteriota bacterium]|nr:protein kinase [Acidobacteriota bacterium]
DLTNETIGRYFVMRKIGSGGMGEVYEAKDELLKRKVALKRVLPRLASQEEFRRRLLREARAISSLSHPGIATLFDVFEIESETFLVMELVNGKPLHQAVRYPIQMGSFLAFARQCAEALGAAHSKGIIHADLKPSNIFLNDSGGMKILDFGLASWLSSGEDTTTNISAITEGSVIYGTLNYLSPEVLQGKPADQRIDLFALGIIFYELLTGLHPFKAQSLPSVVARILNETPTPPSVINQSIPQEVDKMILGLLQKDPDNRYSSAAQIIVDLDQIEKNLKATTLSSPRFSFKPQIKRKIPWKKLLPYLAIVMLVIALGVLIQQSVTKEPPVFAERNWILLSQIENVTNESIFDQTLNEALTISLEQSRHLNVYPRSEIPEVLKRMARNTNTVIDEAIGREICQRENLQVLLTGSIRRSGNNYQFTLRAIDPVDGKLLFVEREEFDKKEQLFSKVDSLSRRVREDLGESRTGINNSAEPLAKVTTPSLKALQHYSRATDAVSKGEIETARVELLSALSLDPNFAMAHHQLGGVYEFLGQPDKQGEEIQRAYDLRQTLTDRERNTIEASYFGWIGEIEKATEILKILTSLYPDDIAARKTLASCYRELGQISKAIAQLREVLKLRPADVSSNSNIILLLARANKNEEAIQAYKKAVEQGIRTPELHWGLGMAYMGLGNFEEARKQFLELQKEGDSYQFIGEFYDVRITAYQGKFSEAIQHLNSGILQDQKSGNKSSELSRRALLSEIFFIEGKPMLVADQLASMTSGKLFDMQSADLRQVGTLYVKLGQLNKAQVLFKELERRVRDVPTFFRKSCYYNLQGELLLAEKKPQEAIDSFLKADTELPWFISHDGLARAYEQLGDLKNAAAEWQKVLNSRGEIFHDGFPPEWILAHLNLARIYHRQNNLKQAQQSYATFYKLWQDADPTPIRIEGFREWQQLTDQH